ncbi:MAG: DinB family protein [Chloroflexota bacterium]|nr:DinB family protein [Chloroflexota bacterium]
MRLSGASALDEVRAGVSLQAIVERHTMDDIVAAVRDAKAGIRYGLAAVDDAGLRRTGGLDPWSLAEVIGHALAVDEAAHRIARSLALGRQPDGDVSYDTPGPPAAGRTELLEGLAAAEGRLAEARVLMAGGPRFAHRDLGELDARGWILFIGVHDALHLHQAAAIVRTPPRIPRP